jgi:hypothetical protein
VREAAFAGDSLGQGDGAAADNGGHEAGVCFQSRVSPLFMKAKEIVTSGGIGGDAGGVDEIRRVCVRLLTMTAGIGGGRGTRKAAGCC